MHVEVRGQLEGGGSLFPLSGDPGIKLKVLGLEASILPTESPHEHFPAACTGATRVLSGILSLP